MRLIFLGGFSVALDDQPVTGFESDKVRALLAYIAMEGERPLRRETLDYRGMVKVVVLGGEDHKKAGCRRAASAMPSPAHMPWPREPALMSTPGVFCITGWPCSRLPNWRSELRCSRPQ